MANYPLPISPRPTSSALHAPLLPIYPPPASALPNPLPSVPSPRSFPDSRYIATSHVVPAAHLRSTPLAKSPPPPPAPATASKAERRARNAERKAWVEAQQTQCGRYERVLWNTVNRYARKASTGDRTGVTLFLAHANGFPKEIWEPTILDLLAIPDGPVIDEIWAWEATHHGASFLLNANMPLAAGNWADDARDVLNFLLHFLPSSIADPLPTHLPRITSEESALRKVRGFNERRLFTVGHSFGGCCCAWAAVTYPRLFTALMLVDPVIIRYGTPNNDPNTNKPSLMEGAIARRDTWSSREEAHATLATNPFFAAWDPRALAAYVGHGLVAMPGSGVTLAMPSIQEALTFEATKTSAPVWDLLPTLEERIPLRWVVPGRPGEPDLGGPGATQERVWRRPANSSNVRIAQAGHLVVQQTPRQMAREIAGMVEGRIITPPLMAKL
ncbi:Alpha/beta hydrolase family-domain-containing protein [Mycena leptocephala]|nr:Alpha/beta hydrolase family-domain-containing protein [Mycena leptocephala]